ncbi:MAG TPA: MMPL family transporter, partial [Pseudonocardiaceae bacterium]|nr:MMPL family transporter [Pseudonocardiaceae bacterium]
MDEVVSVPAAAESTEVSRLLQQLPSSRIEPAIVVYSRDGQRLTPGDRAAVDADARAFAGVAVDGVVPPPVFADGGTAVLVTVPLPAELSTEAVVDTVTGLRAQARDGLPAGLSAQVTGGAGFAADIASVFDGADVSLLLVTVLVVAALLLITYRSPLLWLVPLAVIGAGEQFAAAAVGAAARLFGYGVNAATAGIVSVLVFGAGTNYALLVIARYREQLRRVENRFDAMAAALAAAAPAVVASASTVALSLLTLGVAVREDTRSLGFSGALGIAVALLFSLVVLPAALVVCGRPLFWPFVPRAGQPDRTMAGPWARVGAMVSRRPWAVTAAATVLLAALSAGALGAPIGLPPTEQFRTSAEAIDGQRALARYFSAGTAQPATILTGPAHAEEVARVAAATAGVAGATVGETSGDLTRVDAVLVAEPGSAASLDTIRSLRTALDRVPEANALVGGQVA